MRLSALLFVCLATPVAAHEFWIEPLEYQVDVDGILQADIVNGEEFSGAKFAYFPQRYVNFLMFQGDDVEPVTGRPGDTPALTQDPMGEGLHIAGYQSTLATVAYENWEKFQRFVDHKAFGDVLSQHQARGLSTDGFTEVYGRYAKSLMAVGNGEGSDRRLGLETEIVALTNPYVDDLADGMRVSVFYRDDVRADAQVEVFEKTQAGQVTVRLYQTDQNGIAQFPVQPGHAYLVDAVVLREPATDQARATGAVWETLWASLTFAVPE